LLHQWICTNNVLIKSCLTTRSKKLTKAICKENLTGKLTTKRRRANFHKRRRSFISDFLWAGPVT
jgi:hypothetical protein